MIDRRALEQRLERIQDYGFSGGVDDLRVREAAAQFDGQFPADYLEFLAAMGSGACPHL